MSFDERQIRDVTVLDLEGRLTFTAGSELSDRAIALASRGGAKVILNLERVSYIDSAGLGAIVQAFTHLRSTHGGLKFVNPTARTQHVLHITGITSLIETFATEKLAIDSFAGPLHVS